jgi:hypothetical protein
MDALGEAAADNLTNVDADVEALSKALEGANVLDKDTSKAAGAIVQVLARFTLDAWRKSQVKAIVVEVHPHLEKTLRALQGIVTKDFVIAFESEQADIATVFAAWDKAAVELQDPTGLPPPLRVIGQERHDELERRKAAANKYGEVLAKINQGHAKLATNQLALDDEALIKELKSYAKDLQTLYKSIRTLD